jgi:DNA-binding HxlR family transcriptional regulator
MNPGPTEPAAQRDSPSRESTEPPPTWATLPELTPLQFLVIWLLLEGRKSGRELRGLLDWWGAGMSRPAFSQMMRRLESARLVRRDRVADDSGAGSPVRYCVYQARPNALQRWRAAAAFYARLEEPPGAEQHLFDHRRSGILPLAVRNAAETRQRHARDTPETRQRRDRDAAGSRVYGVPTLSTSGLGGPSGQSAGRR